MLWFRRDLRLRDNPALVAAVESADEIVPLFVVDPVLWSRAGLARRTFLGGCLRSLDESVEGRLVVRCGRPDVEVVAVARAVGAGRVFVTADYGPYGHRRDAAVAGALEAAGAELVPVGSPYAVAPGILTTATGTGFKVFTPYRRAWQAHGWPAPADTPPAHWAMGIASDGPPRIGEDDADDLDASLPPAGEAAALDRLARFVEGIDDYAEGRNVPGEDATSRLSVYLKYGCVHPRQALAAVAGISGAGADRFRTELAWRDFYADTLWSRPDSTTAPLRADMAALEVDSGAVADRRFEAWAAGSTGYPIVDAGMRQLAAEAWMHNRVRMITASFLVKDLHLPWQRGAALFMARLVDGDIASNSHGWQWVAGTGTDPSPYFRVFNPTTQGRKFDPDGIYVRRWVPELRGVTGAAVHEPWKLPGGPPSNYPRPIVDHDTERREALTRYDRLRNGSKSDTGEPRPPESLRLPF